MTEILELLVYQHLEELSTPKEVARFYTDQEIRKLEEVFYTDIVEMAAKVRRDIREFAVQQWQRSSPKGIRAKYTS